MKKHAALASYFKTRPKAAQALSDEDTLPDGLPHAPVPTMDPAQQMKQFGDKNMSVAAHKNQALFKQPTLITCDVGDTEGFLHKISTALSAAFKVSFNTNALMVQILGDGHKVARNISVTESAPVIQYALNKKGYSLTALHDNGDQVWYLIGKKGATTASRRNKTTALFTGLQAMTTGDAVLKRLLQQKQQLETEAKAFQQKHKLAMADVNEKIAQRRAQLKQERQRS